MDSTTVRERSGQVETSESLANGCPQFLSHNGLRAVFGKLEVVDTRHDAGEIVVRGERCFVRFTDDS
jgi:hypothetical protein